MQLRSRSFLILDDVAMSSKSAHYARARTYRRRHCVRQGLWWCSGDSADLGLCCRERVMDSVVGFPIFNGEAAATAANGGTAESDDDSRLVLSNTRRTSKDCMSSFGLLNSYAA